MVLVLPTTARSATLSIYPIFTLSVKPIVLTEERKQSSKERKDAVEKELVAEKKNCKERK
jgi:hypothetical protein